MNRTDLSGIGRVTRAGQHERVQHPPPIQTQAHQDLEHLTTRVQCEDLTARVQCCSRLETLMEVCLFFIPVVFIRVEVRALCRPRHYLHTKLTHSLIHSLTYSPTVMERAVCAGTTNIVTEKGLPKLCPQS